MAQICARPSVLTTISILTERQNDLRVATLRASVGAMAKPSTRPHSSGKHIHPVCRVPATHAQREAWSRAARGKPFAVHARELLDAHAEAQGIRIADKIGHEESEEE